MYFEFQYDAQVTNSNRHKILKVENKLFVFCCVSLASRWSSRFVK